VFNFACNNDYVEGEEEKERKKERKKERISTPLTNPIPQNHHLPSTSQVPELSST
jgi:hypothetical protein